MTARALTAGPLAWMVAASLAACGVAISLAGHAVAREIVFGMAGPLLSVVVSWWVLERTHEATPERLTTVMIAAFGVKMVLFGVYVVVMLTVLSLRPLPFMLSFTGHYITLHLIEAGLLKRLIAGQRSAS